MLSQFLPFFHHFNAKYRARTANIKASASLLSIAENKASCRLPGDKHARIWKLLAKVLIDKTARHFDCDTSILEDDLQHIETGETVIERPKRPKAKKRGTVPEGTATEDIEPINEEL